MAHGSCDRLRLIAFRIAQNDAMFEPLLPHALKCRGRLLQSERLTAPSVFRPSARATTFARDDLVET